jgi:hypothetical protein
MQTHVYVHRYLALAGRRFHFPIIPALGCSTNWDFMIIVVQVVFVLASIIELVGTAYKVTRHSSVLLTVELGDGIRRDKGEKNSRTHVNMPLNDVLDVRRAVLK